MDRGSPERRPRLASIAHAGPLALLAVLLGLFAVGKAWIDGSNALAIDFYQFWAVGRALDDGRGSEVYTPEGRAAIGRELLVEARAENGSPRQRGAAQFREDLDTYSTPLLYSVFAAVHTGDFERDFRVHRALSLVLFVLGIALFGCALGYGTPATALAVALAIHWLAPFHSDLHVGNVAQIQLGLLAIAVALQVRGGKAAEIASGAVLGLAVLFKPNLAGAAGLLVLGRLAGGERVPAARVALGGAVGAVLGVLVSSLAFGSLGCWSDWWHAAAELRSRIAADYPLERGNFALAASLRAWTGIATGALPGVAVAAIVVGAALLVARRRPRGAREIVLLAAAGAGLGLVTATLAWLHYFVLALPLALFAMRPKDADEAAGRAVSRMLGGALGFVLVAVNPALVALGIARAEPDQKALFVVLGTLVLLALSVVEMSWSPPGASNRRVSA